MSNLISHVESSIDNAEKHISKLPKQVIELEGMSSPKVRHFLNNICSRDGTRYLEVGVWKGSTFISALYGNESSIVVADAIDDFSEFYGPYEEFKINCRNVLYEQFFNFHKNRFQNVQPNLSPPINTYFYDGNHSHESQRDALLHFYPCLDSQFIYIVDDWSFPDVKPGTMDAIDKLGCKILKSWDLKKNSDEDHNQWWCGLFVAVIEK